MTWRWRYERGDGTEMDRPNGGVDAFSTQSDAESWVGEQWRDLLESGVDAVTLIEDDREVYGPMSLHPPEE